MRDGRTFWLLAGADGVGKTTYALKQLSAVSGSVRFVNLEEIARGLSPLLPSAGQTDAARIALARARAFIAARQTFAMETTLSGLTHLRLIDAAHAAGMRTSMLYFSVRSPDICLERIARRVAEGGHDVPDDIVRRRYGRSHGNLSVYAARCDLWRVYEASGLPLRLALEGARDAATFADPEVLKSGSSLLQGLATRLS